MLVQLRTQASQVLVSTHFPLWKLHAHLFQITNALPRLWSWRAQNFEYFEKLVNLALALEKRLGSDHFEKDAAERPHVDGRTVNLGAKHDFRCSVPKGHDLVSKALQRQAKRPSQSEVSQFYCFLVVTYENVAGFDVPVHYATLVTVKKGFHDLLHIVSCLIYV